MPLMSTPVKIPERYKGLQRFQKENEIEIIKGSGNGFAEVFFKGEMTSPDPSKNIVEVRDTGKFNPNIVAAGDILHFMGGKKSDGQPFSKEFFNLKKRFIQNMSLEEKQFAKKKYQEFIKEGTSGTNFSSFSNFMDSVWGDALIRGALFPELMTDPKERAMFKDRKIFTSAQKKIIDQMESLIKGN